MPIVDFYHAMQEVNNFKSSGRVPSRLSGRREGMEFTRMFESYLAGRKDSTTSRSVAMLLTKRGVPVEPCDMGYGLSYRKSKEK